LKNLLQVTALIICVTAKQLKFNHRKEKCVTTSLLAVLKYRQKYRLLSTALLDRRFLSPQTLKAKELIKSM